jgi:hypothetical protein
MRPAFVPLIATLAGAAGAWYFNAHLALGAKEERLLAAASAAASVGATLLGFMLAALAVLASINHTHLVQMMRRYGHYDDLLATVFAGCVVMLAGTVIGFIVLFGVVCHPWVLWLLIGCHVGALASLVDVGRKFRFTLANLRHE